MQPAQQYIPPVGTDRFAQTAPYYPPAPPQRVDVCAILGLVFGCLGILSLCFPWPFSLTGVVLSSVSLGRIKRDPSLTGRSIAIWGLVASFLPLVFALVVVGLSLFGAATAPPDTTPLYPANP